MLLINCEVILILTWSKDCSITYSNSEGKSKITDAKRYVPVTTFSTQDDSKLFQRLKYGLREKFTGTNDNQNHSHRYKTDI